MSASSGLEKKDQLVCSRAVFQAGDSIRTGHLGLGRELKQMGEDLSLTLCISLTLFRAGENGPYLAVLSAVMTVITIAAFGAVCWPRAVPPFTHLKVETVIISALMNVPVRSMLRSHSLQVRICCRGCWAPKTHQSPSILLVKTRLVLSPIEMILVFWA